MKETEQYNLEIIAGPCSINHDNVKELYQIANIRAKGKPAIYGTRVVGLKSRTELNPTGEGMGIDYEALLNGEETPPSVMYAEAIVEDTDMLVSTEVMDPDAQIPHYEGRIPSGKLLLWNPSVNQLGFPVARMTRYARINGWDIGLKNGKALGTTLKDAETMTTPMEKTWLGLATYAKDNTGRTIFIHRGVDIPEKGDFRNALTHESARRVKNKVPGALLYLDPSHSYGPKLREEIVPATINAMAMKNGNNYLYDGILIEAGTSETDTEQHISLTELEILVKELATFRQLRAPEPMSHHFYESAVADK